MDGALAYDEDSSVDELDTACKDFDPSDAVDAADCELDIALDAAVAAEVAAEVVEVVAVAARDEVVAGQAGSKLAEKDGASVVKGVVASCAAEDGELAVADRGVPNVVDELADAGGESTWGRFVEGASAYDKGDNADEFDTACMDVARVVDSELDIALDVAAVVEVVAGLVVVVAEVAHCEKVELADSKLVEEGLEESAAGDADPAEAPAEPAAEGAGPAGEDVDLVGPS